MTFKRNSVAAALADESGMGRDTPLTPPKCEDCAHFRYYKPQNTPQFVRPEDGSIAIPGTPTCYDEENNRGIDAREVRADEDGCGPDGVWFAPKIVLVQ